jgi:hypothetical protein
MRLLLVNSHGRQTIDMTDEVPMQVTIKQIGYETHEIQARHSIK